MSSRLHKSILTYFILSVVLHVFIATGIFIFDELNKKPVVETISLDVVSPNPAQTQITKNLKKVIPPPDKQIVDQDEKPVNDETPDKTRFMSRNNQTVVKQTVSRNKGEFQNKHDQITPPKGSQTKSTPTLKDLTPHFDAFASMQKQVEQEKEKSEKLKKGQQYTENSKTGEASQSPDYMKDLEVADETLLSTKEFKYYTYFNRIRRQLSQYWEPKVREKMSKMFQQGRRIASEDDKITKLVIFLNSTGQLVKVQVISESGVRDLDEAAIEAFKAAAPFPNPPRGIIDPDGTAKIRWDFILES